MRPDACDDSDYRIETMISRPCKDQRDAVTSASHFELATQQCWLFVTPRACGRFTSQVIAWMTGSIPMRTRLVRRPGQHGTKDLVAQYGEQLICVRYRYDSIRKKRYKTVELIVETVDWSPPLASDTIVAL
jgi:hypothetical protein